MPEAVLKTHRLFQVLPDVQIPKKTPGFGGSAPNKKEGKTYPLKLRFTSDQYIDYSLKSILHDTLQMTIEVLDIIPGRDQDEYPLVLNKTPDFKLCRDDPNDGQEA